MYNIYPCVKMNDTQFDTKKDISLVTQYIDKFKLNVSCFQKEYWINNVLIKISENNPPTFKYIKDNTIEYDEKNKVLIQNYTFEPCDSYNFYQSDNEEFYQLYENTIDNVSIILKKYDNYFTLTFETNNLSNFYNNDIFYI